MFGKLLDTKGFRFALGGAVIFYAGFLAAKADLHNHIGDYFNSKPKVEVTSPKISEVSYNEAKIRLDKKLEHLLEHTSDIERKEVLAHFLGSKVLGSMPKGVSKENFDKELQAAIKRSYDDFKLLLERNLKVERDSTKFGFDLKMPLDEKIKYFNDFYNIEVNFTDFKDSGCSLSTTSINLKKAKNSQKNTASQVLNLIDYQLMKFPRFFLGGQKVSLFVNINPQKKVTCEDNYSAVTTDLGNRMIFYSIGSLDESFEHEMDHIATLRGIIPHNENEWASFNNIKYQGENWKIYSINCPMGFTRKYGIRNFLEDRATVLESLLDSEIGYCRSPLNDEILTRKIATLKRDYLIGSFGTIGNDFWTTLKDRKKISHDFFLPRLQALYDDLLRVKFN